MITAWRIVAENVAAQAFSGQFAKMYGGRWSTAGAALVYTNECASLALLELLVQMRGRLLYDNYMVIPCVFPEDVVEEIDRSRLQSDWNESPPPLEVQQVGDAWIRQRRSAVLKVPSAIVHIQSNYLLNPDHADFSRIEIGEPRPFHLDVRLVS